MKWELISNEFIDSIHNNYYIYNVRYAKQLLFLEEGFHDHYDFFYCHGSKIQFIVTSDVAMIYELQDKGITPSESIEQKNTSFALYEFYELALEVKRLIFEMLIIRNSYTTQTLFFVSPKDAEMKLCDFIVSESKKFKENFYSFIPYNQACFVFEWDSSGINFFYNNKEWENFVG